jgi:hypothetical protein
MSTAPKDMTDLQLDITLEHCFSQHRDADPGRRQIIHNVVMDVLTEQAARRDEALGLSRVPAITTS